MRKRHIATVNDSVHSTRALKNFDFVHCSYVSRYHVKDSARHVILGTQQFKPNEFASQINLSMENAWGILRCVIDICRKLNEGKYLILKDPNKVSNNTHTTPCSELPLNRSSGYTQFTPTFTFIQFQTLIEV